MVPLPTCVRTSDQSTPCSARDTGRVQHGEGTIGDNKATTTVCPSARAHLLDP